MMTINAKHPKFLSFIKNERKTLQWLSQNKYVNNKLKELAVCAKNCLLTFPTKDQQLLQTDMKFTSVLNLTVENTSRATIIEVEVGKNFQLVSYSLSICQGNSSPYNLIRRFHFDYAIPIAEDPDPKPVYHLQYGGKQTPELQNLQIDIEHLHPWLSSPRLYYIPLNLALFLDILFYEFRGEETKGLVERDEWRQLIKENEDEILKPYIDNLGKFITAHHKKDYLIRDFYYGKQ